MSGRGGKRPGAGRPPKRILNESPIRVAEQKIFDRLPWLVDKLMELAEGVEIQRTDRQGQTRIYSEPPDREAIKYMVDRVLGKAMQPIGHSGEIDHKVTQVETIRRALGLVS